MREWIEIADHMVDTYDFPEQVDSFLAKYKTYDLLVPIFHGRYGEDGIITAMCETLWIRVAWSSSGVHALCIDKYWTNCVVEKLGIMVPKSWMPGLPRPPKLLPDADQDGSEPLEISLIVKPNQWGSSLATTKATTLEEFKNGIQGVNDIIESLTTERVKLLSSPAMDGYIRTFPPISDLPLVQECIEWREFTVWVYRDASWTQVLPIIEIIPLWKDFFDYAEKYETDGSNEVFTDIESILLSDLEEMSRRIYEFLGCRGIVRIDYRYDGQELYFLEVNTIPGFTAGSLVPKMWKKAGKTEEEFVEMLFS